jgi:DTW domain-containing protein YfiP
LDIESFKQRRQQILHEAKTFRNLCLTCLQPQFSCYCSHIQSFDTKIKFVILIHPIEMKRRIATGRMSHLSLQNSELIVGQDYSQNQRVNEILQNPNYHPVILYPGPKSQNLSGMTYPQKDRIFAGEKLPVIFVIDGTWATARKTIYQSQNLLDLPRICFNPPGPSQFRVRKQPGAECYSTIEAIHHTLDLLGNHVGFDVSRREHDRLITVFNNMVERQLGFIREAQENLRPSSYRRPQPRVRDI